MFASLTRYAVIVTGLLVAAASAEAQTARLQVVHNAADPAAETVDIYVGEDRLLDDFGFRQATPFIDVPAATELMIGVAPGSSQSSGDALATFPITLEDGETYIVMATGVLDPNSFADNPDLRPSGFNLYATDGARERGRRENRVDLIAYHGVTDAPGVDVRVRTRRGSALLFGPALYSDFSGYATVSGIEYMLDVTVAGDENAVVASYAANLDGLEGGAAVVFASGFLSPSDNQMGPAFGLFAALPDGTVIELPALAAPELTARLQVIHNAADPAAEVVDIYVNDVLTLDDFRFREATPFIDVPAGVELAVGVAPGNSMSSADAIATFPLRLEAGTAYVGVATGVLDPSGFAANPDGNEIGFTIAALANARERSSRSNRVEVAVFHGSTDAPAVDVLGTRNRFTARLVDDIAYGEFTRYAGLSARPYVLDVTLADDNEAVVVSYDADLTGLRGGAAIVFASGFLSPADNQMGPAFGLFVALPDGTVLELPALAPHPAEARLQVIHNAADPGAEMVDIYLGEDLILDDFAFRTASPFVTVPANVELMVGVAPSTSTSSADAIATFPVRLEADGTFVAVANGVLDPNGFAPNPDGRSIGFDLFAAAGREMSTKENRVDVLVYHGSTDAPTVDVLGRRGPSSRILIDDASYGDFVGYAQLPPASYLLDVTPGNDNDTIVATFAADLSGLRGGAAVVFASGFLDPSVNGDGPAFGLFAALPDGTVLELPAGDPPRFSASNARAKLEQNAPNPFNPTTNISFALDADSDVSLFVYNVQGQVVRSLVNSRMAAGTHSVTFDGSGLASGIYYYELRTADSSTIRKMTLLK